MRERIICGLVRPNILLKLLWFSRFVSFFESAGFDLKPFLSNRTITVLVFKGPFTQAVSSGDIAERRDFNQLKRPAVAITGVGNFFRRSRQLKRSTKLIMSCNSALYSYFVNKK